MNIFFILFVKLKRFFIKRRLDSIQILSVGYCDNILKILCLDKKNKNIFISDSIKENYFKIKYRILVKIFNQDIEEDITDCRSFSFWQENNKYFISYTKPKNKKNYVFLAEATNLERFYIIRQHMIDGKSVFVINNGDYSEKPVYYVEDDNSVKVYGTKTKRSIELRDTRILPTRENYFDKDIKIIGAINSSEGILIMYYSIEYDESDEGVFSIGCALFSRHNFSYLIWRSEQPLFRKKISKNSYGEISPLGVLVQGDIFRIFFNGSESGLFSVKINDPFLKSHAKTKEQFEKNLINPIIQSGENDWESVAVFNPAVYYDGDKHHMLYRAIGDDGVSRLGYSSSSNGHHFEDRLHYPALQIQSPRNGKGTYDPVLYASGGSWGGVEDPRMVVIDGIVYVTASVFDGWDFIRMAAFSIAEKDFVGKCFKWNGPVYLSPPGVMSKNWVIFPEKINGKFAIFHGIEKGGRTKANIDYVDSLDSEDVLIESDDTFRKEIDRNVWDSMIRGAGPPPLKTKYGWLLFYHATDHKEPHKYKLGAMLLDIDDPSKILYRSKYPLLEPNEHYENNGKPGVVYATGATLEGDNIKIYYGGADAVVCCASMSLDTLINSLRGKEVEDFITKMYLY